MGYMNRRIIKQGNNSYTITLPIKWIRQNNLIGNEEILVEEEENSLKITTTKKLVRKNIAIQLQDNNARSIRFLLQQAYRQNYDQINLNYDSEEIYKSLVEIIDHYFVGLEVALKQRNSCTLSVIVETNEEKFNLFLRKMFLLIRDSLHSLSLKDCASIHYNYLKLYAYQNYGKRYLYSTKAELCSYDYYSLLSYLLNIHADIDKFAFYLKNLDNINKKYKSRNSNQSVGKSDKDITNNKFDEKIKIIVGLFEDVERNFYLKKIDVLMKITDNIQQNIADLLKIDNLQKVKVHDFQQEDILVLHYQVEILRLLYGALSPLMGIVLYEVHKTS